MKIHAFLTSAVIAASLFSVPGYGVSYNFPVNSTKCEVTENNRNGKESFEEFKKDPVGALEKRKAEILELKDKGEISKDKADAMIKKIDAKIAEIKDFNKLSLEQKREKLINGCKSRLDTLVRDGKLERKKADEMLKDYSLKIRQWDGTGYPKFYNKSMKDKKH